MKEYIDKSDVNGLVQIGWSGDAIVTAILNDGVSSVPAIPLDRIKEVRKQIIDEKDFAYADFEQYKEEVLHVESDELPDDDFRFGMERCLEILDKLIESEVEE